MTSRIVPLPESGFPAKLHGMGPRGIAMLKEALAAKGLDFPDNSSHQQKAGAPL
ncbi:hypothetical protein [Paenibacillus camerounensis]|uniref:hypothetical protein n=1 Tax=Paenibacillus camerounensis TaxID=1243663 RepID=UPI000AB3C57F|nr:hypothetical protein [Paenibacillus camerounensis]